MLRLLHKFILKEAVSTVYKRSSISLSKMSSEAIEDSAKRKPDETCEDETSSKKLKVSEEDSLHEDVKSLITTSKRIRKPKKAVLLLSYLGKEYYGMQRNNDVSTVEEELLKALLETGIIIQEEFDFPKTMKFQRAARTDKGVSAVRQIVSLKIPVKEIDTTLSEKVNKSLPPEIRLIAAKRVIQSFDAKVRCDARTYSYMFPTFALSPDAENDEEYRITADSIDKVNKFLQNYLGTRNFYNFTSGRLSDDPSCRRYIMACECGPPFVSHGIEFSVIKVKGQSFMLHQIRKMVGLAIAFMRNLADESVLNKAWLKERLDIPKAPGLGLMLEELHYDWYNKKYGSDGMHEPLVWDEYDDVVNEFKREKICSNIAITEKEEKSMMQWLETLPHHTYDVREDGPPSVHPSENNSSVSENVEMVDASSIKEMSAVNTELLSDSSPKPVIPLDDNVNSSSKLTELSSENVDSSVKSADLTNENADCSTKSIKLSKENADSSSESSKLSNENEGYSIKTMELSNCTSVSSSDEKVSKESEIKCKC